MVPQSIAVNDRIDILRELYYEVTYFYLGRIVGVRFSVYSRGAFKFARSPGSTPEIFVSRVNLSHTPRPDVAMLALLERVTERLEPSERIR